MLMGMVLLLGVVQCAQTEHARVFHARDYGAVPGSPEDAGPALRAAIVAAIQADAPGEVRLEAGVYRVAPAPGQPHALPVHGARALTIRGAGSATCIVVTEPSAGAFDLQDCEGIALADLRIDYDPVPFTQGTVVAVDETGGWFDLRCDPGYLMPDAPCFAAAQAPWGLVVSEVPEGGEQFGPVPVWTSAWAEREGGLWRATIEAGKDLKNTGVRPGARFAHMARRYAASGVMAWRCRNVTIECVTVHCAPATASIWGMNENVTIRGLRVDRPAGTRRLLSTNADGIHCLGNRGTLLIEDCHFEAMADDAINIHARAGVALGQPAPNQLLVGTGGTTEYRSGDHIQVYDPEAGRVRAERSKITEVEQQDAGVLLTLDRAVEEVAAGSTFRDADHVFNLDACGAGAVIQKCEFGLHRGRAVLLKTIGARIEANCFRNREGWGVALHQLQDWGEGPAARDVLIRSNRFEGVGTGWAPFIDIRPSNRANAPAEGRPVRNVRIEGNRMVRPHHAVLHAWAVQDLVFSGNTIEAAPAAAFPLIHLFGGGGFVIRDCQIGSDAASDSAPMCVENGVDSGVQGIVVEEVTVFPPFEAALLDDNRGQP